ncbi:MAG: glycerophosphodiester phosphodiesterase [Halieaceae bacterium]|nr:glycerophosphodiester phosphodiesterase [Halieaceae bacterium]
MSRLIMALAVWLVASNALAAGTLVIAHRGASGYLPEHTQPAVAMAYAQGADYIEQDVVLTKDDVPIVLHDLTLDATTDVAEVFPGRARDDGKHYAIDFTLDEIRQLRVGERRRGDGPAFEGRFPDGVNILRVPTLAEEIELIQGLNQSTGGDVGIYVELKHPDFHAAEGRSFPASVLQILYAYGYRGADDRVFLQCFDEGTLRFLKDHTEIRLVQLVEDKNLTAERAQAIASYAQGVGPWIAHLTDRPEFVVAAQEAGLEVHPYTFRADALPRGMKSYRALLDRFIRNMKVNGVFTDHPDLTRRYVDSLGATR